MSQTEKSSKQNSSLEELATDALTAALLAGAGFVIMFVFKLLAARYYGAHDFGVFSLLKTVLGLSIIIAGLGFAPAVSRYVPHYRITQQFSLLKGYLKFVLLTSLISGIIFGYLLYIFATDITVFFGFPVEFAQFIKIVGFVIPLAVIDRAIKRFFIGWKRLELERFSLNIIEKGILLLGILGILLFELNLLWLVIIFIASKSLPTKPWSGLRSKNSTSNSKRRSAATSSLSMIA